MTTTAIPRAFLAPGRSAFAVIDPVTERYHRLLDQSGALQLSTTGKSGSYFAISYVWSDWKESIVDKFPSWRLIRERLIMLAATDLATNLLKAPTDIAQRIPLKLFQPDSFRCWLDSKCIDQNSPADKIHWIPRMNEIYFDARCTMLLLRDVDLTALYELLKLMKCLIAETSPERGFKSHRCLFTPSCISLVASIPPSVEQACLDSLEALWKGSWRKRAWIFQEILLSARYMLSWGDKSTVAYMELGTVGRIAAFLHQRHPDKSWLHDFWSWCKQCHCLREFYTEKLDMEATVLQLAEHLEATVACDKYYALCGILGLKDVVYNANHNAEEALNEILSALTKQGRMGWMYAIPPSVSGAGIALSDSCMAPFFLTRKKRQASIGFYQGSFVSEDFMGFTAVEMGFVQEVTSLETFIQQLGSSVGSLHTQGIKADSFRELYGYSTTAEQLFPAILHRLGYDIISPFREHILFDRLRNAFGITGPPVSLTGTDTDAMAFWEIVVRLCFVETSSFEGSDPLGQQLVQMSADRVQSLCKTLVSQGWCVVHWQTCEKEPRAQVAVALLDGPSDAYRWAGMKMLCIRTQRSQDSLLLIGGSEMPYVARDDDADQETMTRKPSTTSTQLRDSGTNFFSIALQTPRLQALSNFTHPACHDNAAELHRETSHHPIVDDVISTIESFSVSAADDVISTLESFSTSVADNWNRKVKLFLVQRQRSVTNPRPTVHHADTIVDLVGLFAHQDTSLENPRSPVTSNSVLEREPSSQVDYLYAMFPSLDWRLVSDVFHNSSGLDAAIDACLQLTDTGLNQAHDTTGSRNLYDDASWNPCGTGTAQTGTLIDLSPDSESEPQSSVSIDRSLGRGNTDSLHNDVMNSTGKADVFAHSRSGPQDSLI
ncbi:unnamed protein product [Alternaria sp. RS040]